MTDIKPLSQTLPADQRSEDFFIIIASWVDDAASEITIQDFYRDGEQFIPLFSDDAHFEKETAGSGYEKHGVYIRKDLLRSIIKDDPLFILNPGSDAIPLRVTDII